VVLEVTRGEPLHWQPPDEKIAPQLAELVPQEVRAMVADRKPEDQFKIERMWTWHPLGNEELIVGGGCAHPSGNAACGVVVARMRFDKALLLSWVPSDWWQPIVGETETAREIYLYGGDWAGAFRKRVSYAWGRIAIGGKERKKRRKGQREPTY